MKSWGAFLITLVGFLLGVVLAGIGGIAAKTTFFSDSSISTNSTTNKKIEKYWNDTGLSETELYDLVSNSNCQSSEKYFVACLNSIIQPLNDKHLYLSAETGEVETDYSGELTNKDLSEKQMLAPYLQMYPHRIHKLVDFEKIWKKLLKSENKDAKAALIASGINNFLSIYKDPHTYILPENYYEEVGSQIGRSNLFVGLSFEKVQAKTLIRKVFKNSDADLSGLLPFDDVLEINHNSTKNLNLSEISQILKDASVSKFTFKILRNGDLKEITVERQYKVLSHVQFEILHGFRQFGLLTITRFNRGVCEESARLLRGSAEEHITGLILDLRDNPGGQLDEAACLAGLFLGMNKKTYSVSFFDPLKANEVVLSTGSLLYTGPMVVLVNSSSASASELLAGALQDYKRAIIVGERTFGKGTFQESEKWNKNERVSLFKTQGFYLLPSNRSPQLVGINPDFEIDENHLKIREENNYFNPLQYEQPETSVSHLSSDLIKESLDLCLNYSDIASIKEATVQKGIQILSCHRITSQIAQQYSPEEFN